MEKAKKLYAEITRDDVLTEEGRRFLRHLVDNVWQHIWEDQSVPATSTSDKLINEAIDNWNG